LEEEGPFPDFVVKSFSRARPQLLDLVGFDPKT